MDTLRDIILNNEGDRDDIYSDVTAYLEKESRLEISNGMSYEDLILKAIDKWGIDVQIDKIQEEALELSLALHQYKCPTKDKDKMLEKIYEELADMEIMMMQAHHLFNSSKIKQDVKRKLEKLHSKHLSE